MYRSVTFKRGDDVAMYACNKEHEGLFEKNYKTGEWIQQLGTGATPIFRDTRHFSRWLRRHWSSPIGAWTCPDPDWEGWRMVDSKNWDA